MSRITLKLKNPNAKFKQWIRDWIEKEPNNLLLVRSYSTAIESLEKYPLRLETGKDCFILEGFDEDLCHRINSRLRQERQLPEKISHSSPKKQKVAAKVPKPKKSPVKKSKVKEFERFELSPGEFEVILLVDRQEGAGKSKHTHTFYDALTKYNIRYEDRRLNVGDFAWIARHRSIVANELALPYVVERKRMDDFASSIKDGRYHEQKFRLRKCGIDNLIYLIESTGGSKQMLGLPLENVMQAAVNTQIQSAFQIKFTEGNFYSGLYLAVLTKQIIEQFKVKTLMSCPKDEIQPFNRDDRLIYLMTFDEFHLNSSKTKNLTVRDIFLKQLVKLKSLSVPMALAIVEKYPTPRYLIDAYKWTSKSEGELLIAELKFGPTNRAIGPRISKILYQLYTTQINGK